MSFQSTVSLDQGFGVVGSINFEGPLRARPGVIKGDTASYLAIGRAFTIDIADGAYTAGGTGVFGGILANPKAYASYGTIAGGPLAPTLLLPAGTVGEFVTMGQIVVAAANAVNIGDVGMFNNTTGVISALPANITYTGVIANTTGVLTVSSASTGANIYVGMPVVGTGVPGGTFVTGLGTGTGGNGTYTTNITTAVSSFTNGRAENVAPSGSTLIVGSAFIAYQNTAAGLAVLSLTGQ